jgi:asparagine synthase (glutamine-hydrolysing)
MCGICGILGDIPRQNIEPMLSAIQHRGPDDSGIFQEEGIALGMTRLAIMDITQSGHQPMCNDDRSVWIVYNGETYNFQEEREVLKRNGYSFNSNSDTEVVLRMYEYYGEDFLKRMRGMFALAIYDKRKGHGNERLLLARDHLGIKPLLYANIESGFVFASEIKSMLAGGLIEKKIDPESLGLLLAFGSIPQPKSIISGIKMLLPGHYMIIEHGKERIEQYWKLGLDKKVGLRKKTYGELVAETKSAMEECVSKQMVSDVPIGAFLSGGVDSSLLVALMSKLTGHKVRTFSVGFEEEGNHIDETSDAERVAKFIGTDHTNVIVTGREVRERIHHIVKSLDQPSIDGVNSYFVSLAASRSVTVAISGTGGDELFAGYPWFTYMVSACNWSEKHHFLSSALKFLARLSNNKVFDCLIPGRFGRIVSHVRNYSNFISLYVSRYQIFGVHGASRTLTPKMRHLSQLGRTWDRINLPEEIQNGSTVERVSSLCLRGYTQNQLLRDIDAVSMAHSLEVRVPFLDPEIVDLAFSLPTFTKLKDVYTLPDSDEITYRNTGQKKILIDIGDGLVPKGMDLQTKRGFGMPFDAWLRGPIKDVLEDTLSSNVVLSRGLFNEKEVQSIKDDFFAGKGSWTKPWMLMIIELWCREMLDG